MVIPNNTLGRWVSDAVGFFGVIFSSAGRALSFVGSVLSPLANQIISLYREIFVQPTGAVNGPVPIWLGWLLGYLFLLLSCFLAWRHERRKELAAIVKKSLETLSYFEDIDKRGDFGNPASSDWWTQVDRTEILGRELRASVLEIVSRANKMHIDKLQGIEKLDRVMLRIKLKELERGLGIKESL